MKNIRFRAWDGNKMMENVSILLISENAAYPNMRGDFHDSMQWDEEGLIYDPIVMRYTGLKDKKNIEIYEGDLYQVAFNKVYEVRFCEGGESNFEWYGGCFILYANEEQFFPFDKWAIDNGEVIGNIYENPELLNKQ